MRKKLLPVIIVFLSMAVAGQVQYTGEVNSEEVRINTTLNLECSSPCPVSRWSLTWTVPENSEIISIKDSYGEVDKWEKNGRSLSITTNSGETRRKETVKIQLVIDEEAQRIYEDLKYRRFSIPSFQGEPTSGRFEVENLVSGWIGFGFRNSFSGNEFVFEGEGPTNIRVNFGEGTETTHYEFFGRDKENSSQAYRVALGTTGISQDYDRIPVAVMDPDSYNESVNEWSSGEYVAGTITLREDLEEDYLPVLTHETIHALNDEFLRWDQTRSAYLDEGVSEHTEYLMKKKLYSEGRIDTGTREIFGDEKTYTVQREDGRYRYTLPSQGDREVLWQYYQQDSDFMQNWNAENSEYRRFGYAYSELLIKNYVVNQGTIRDLYSQIRPERRIESAEDKWDYLSQFMEMKPCDYETRERFDECLDDINSHDYSIYTATPSQNTDSESIRFEEIKVPNRTERERKAKERENSGEELSFQDVLKGFIEYVLSLI